MRLVYLVTDSNVNHPRVRPPRLQSLPLDSLTTLNPQPTALLTQWRRFVLIKSNI